MNIISKISSQYRKLLNYKILVDPNINRGNFNKAEIGYNVSLFKEEISRKYILSKEGDNLNFLDVGGGSGELEYLLGVEKGLSFNQKMYTENLAIFNKKYQYTNIELEINEKKNTIFGDICDPEYLQNKESYNDFFDVIYSNNAFEHFKKPWIAARNMVAMLKKNGLCIVVVPFSQRYHEVPGDYFRYTHTGLPLLFQEEGNMRVIVSGYDIVDRRVNWQGGGNHNDICPVDKFGAWRENWFVVCVLEKI